ncbi:group 1 truncated hemoglobin [Nonomuraea sp. NEAU-A123]|uniref:group I truncated hemoglobin n=1 Tax=Nonomuraea sp. NEAU-A123 TaxID=2839649 RepID=UPI001BE3D904|nr:group 1 truncated hemoglobin [Nonomuraea sp. NEAU-A123]MBT2231079.1 group 1 truncated hemoglobin [Nonomuraea sp. NEAU-A123]
MVSHYEKIGGAPTVRDVVDRFYTLVLDDPDLKPYFADVDMARLKRHMVMLLCSVLGGPEVYEGHDLADAHQGMGVTGEHYEKVGGLLIMVLRDEYGADEEVVQHVLTVLGQVRGSIVEKPAEAAQ